MAQHKNKIYLILIAFIFFGCNEVNTPTKTRQIVISKVTEPLILVEIDSCEYLYAFLRNGELLTHKGNCKFCEQRKTK